MDSSTRVLLQMQSPRNATYWTLQWIIVHQAEATWNPVLDSQCLREILSTCYGPLNGRWIIPPVGCGSPSVLFGYSCVNCWCELLDNERCVVEKWCCSCCCFRVFNNVCWEVSWKKCCLNSLFCFVLNNLLILQRNFRNSLIYISFFYGFPFGDLFHILQKRKHHTLGL